MNRFFGGEQRRLMNTGALVWLIIFCVSAIGFFLIAGVVAVKGLGDLRTLLRHSGNDGAQR